jgi:hypothetical protein
MLCVFQDTRLICFRFINQQKDYTERFAMYSICMVPVILLSLVTRCHLMNSSVNAGLLIFALKPFNYSFADSCRQTALRICLSECRQTIRFGVLMTIIYIRTRLIVATESMLEVG